MQQYRMVMIVRFLGFEALRMSSFTSKEDFNGISGGARLVIIFRSYAVDR
jgi:hypothetical protein